MREKRDRNRKTAHRRSQAGFSFLELLVLMLVIGILAAIGIFNYRRSLPKLRLTNTGTEVVAFLNRARLTAIRMNRLVTVSVQTQVGSSASPYNPSGIDKEYLVLSVTDAFGDREEISFYQLTKSYPPVYLWGEDEDTVGGPSSVTFPSGALVYNSDGTVTSTGAFRFSSPNDGTRNIIEVAILTRSGSPELRKYLAVGDRPTGAESQEYFTETTATITERNRWVWY